MFFVRGMHQRRLMGLVVTAFAAVLVSSCGGGGGSNEDSTANTTTTEDTEQATTTGGGEQASEDALNAALEKSFEEGGAPGVVAAVQTPEYTWIRALGVADRTSEDPMTPDVYHRIGSVNKTFTGTLLLQAEAEGLLSLDDTIDRYVDGVPNGDKITLRQMADMTSGVADYSQTEQFDDELASDPYQVWEPEQLVQIGLKDSPLFDPGTEWQYSNTNYILLGLVLEQVTGETALPRANHRTTRPPRHLVPRPRGLLPSRSARPGLHPQRPILRWGAPRHYRLELLLGMDGRRDDLDGGGLAGLRSGVGHRRGPVLP
jgi:hypothetical protein